MSHAVASPLALRRRHLILQRLSDATGLIPELSSLVVDFLLYANFAAFGARFKAEFDRFYPMAMHDGVSLQATAIVREEPRFYGQRLLPVAMQRVTNRLTLTLKFERNPELARVVLPPFLESAVDVDFEVDTTAPATTCGDLTLLVPLKQYNARDTTPATRHSIEHLDVRVVRASDAAKHAEPVRDGFDEPPIVPVSFDTSLANTTIAVGPVVEPPKFQFLHIEVFVAY